MRHSSERASERSLFLRLGSWRVGDAIARNSDGVKLGMNDTEVWSGLVLLQHVASCHASIFGKYLMLNELNSRAFRQIYSILQQTNPSNIECTYQPPPPGTTVGGAPKKFDKSTVFFSPEPNLHSTRSPLSSSSSSCLSALPLSMVKIGIGGPKRTIVGPLERR